MRVYRSSFDDGERPSRVISQALASFDGIPVEDADDLDRYVNPDGLDALFDAAFDPDQQELLVSFLVEGHQVLLFGDRSVLIRDLGTATRPD